MKNIKCTPGNHPCGKRCIPKEQKCRKGEVKEEKKKTPNGTQLRNLATAVGIVAGTGIALTVISTTLEYVKSHPDEFYEEIYNEPRFPSRDVTFAMSPKDFVKTDGEANQPFMDQAKMVATHPEFSKHGGKSYTGDDILEHKDLNPKVRQLLIDRNIDLDNMLIMEWDEAETVRSSILQKELKQLEIPPTTRGYSLSATSGELIALRKGGKKEIVLNHEIIHAIQKRSGWILSDEKYNEILQNEKNSPHGGKLGQVGSWYIDQLNEVNDIWHKAAQDGKITKTQARAAKDITLRLEFEAWWITEYDHYDDIG